MTEIHSHYHAMRFSPFTNTIARYNQAATVFKVGAIDYFDVLVLQLEKADPWHVINI